MKENIIEYKEYRAVINVNMKDKIVHGRVIGVSDLILFEAEDINGIELEFHNAVNDYLEFCKEVGKIPQKEYKGCLNIRIDPEIHKRVHFIAEEEDASINSIINIALEEFVSKREKGTKVESIHVVTKQRYTNKESQIINFVASTAKEE